MSRARFIELSRARTMLEGMAGEAACAPRERRHSCGTLSDINDAMKRSIEADDLHGALSHNTAFHFALYRSAGMQVVLPLIEMLWLQAGPFLALSLLDAGGALDRALSSGGARRAAVRQWRRRHDARSKTTSTETTGATAQARDLRG